MIYLSRTENQQLKQEIDFSIMGFTNYDTCYNECRFVTQDDFSRIEYFIEISSDTFYHGNNRTTP